MTAKKILTKHGDRNVHNTVGGGGCDCIRTPLSACAYNTRKQENIMRLTKSMCLIIIYTCTVNPPINYYYYYYYKKVTAS